MSREYNHIVLLGYLLREPELRHTRSGTPLARSAISAPKYWRTKGGELVRDKMWINFTIFGASAEWFCTLCRKGDSILISGWLKLEDWEGRDGQRRWSHSVNCKEWKYILSKDLRDTYYTSVDKRAEKSENKGSWHRPKRIKASKSTDAPPDSVET